VSLITVSLTHLIKTEDKIFS